MVPITGTWQLHGAVNFLLNGIPAGETINVTASIFVSGIATPTPEGVYVQDIINFGDDLLNYNGTAPLSATYFLPASTIVQLRIDLNGTLTSAEASSGTFLSGFLLSP